MGARAGGDTLLWREPLLGVVALVPRLGRALHDQAVGAKKWCGSARVLRPVHLLDPQTTGSGDPGLDEPGVLQPLADVVDDQLQAPPPPRRGARQGTERLEVRTCHGASTAS